MKVSLEVIAGPHKGRTYDASEHACFLVGRSEHSHLRLLNDGSCSRNHFLIEMLPPLCRGRDLSSANGTLINGKRIRESQLNPGDVIKIGQTSIRLTIAEEDATVHLPFQDAVAQRPPTPGALPEIPGYKVLSKLGEGGMSIIYLCTHHASGERRAVKMVPQRGPAPEEANRHFLREAMTLSTMKHPNIVQFKDAGFHSGFLYFALEYVEGEDGQKLTLNQGGRLGTAEAVKIAAATLRGLQYAHDRGFVHRDIKPSNIFVGKGGVIKLGDFGLAKSFSQAGFSGFTITGTIGGTVHFMPPEQITDFRGAKPTADIYSLGATLYFFLSGGYVNDFPTGRDPLDVILDDPPVLLRTRVPHITPSLAAVVDQAVHKDPVRRFQTAGEMLDRLLKA